MATSSALAFAAGKPPTYQNLFGLPTGPMTPDGGPMTAPSTARQPQTLNAPTQTAAIPIPTTPATTPGAAGAPTPTVNTTFNLQTDPALQQVNALAGLSDQQANAQALKQRQQQLIQYGDPTLAAAVLGQSDPTVQAAGQNQESDLAMLGRERDQNLHQFENQLDPSLAFSGYRVGQEHLLGQAFQDALAKAAAGVNGNLDSITGQLNAELAGNNTNRINALGTAEANQIQLLLGGGGASPPPGPGGLNFGPDNPIPDYFAPLNNLTPQDWASLAALPANKPSLSAAAAPRPGALRPS
jgi:hypothetical protein